MLLYGYGLPTSCLRLMGYFSANFSIWGYKRRFWGHGYGLEGTGAVTGGTGGYRGLTEGIPRRGHWILDLVDLWGSATATGLCRPGNLLCSGSQPKAFRSLISLRNEVRRVCMHTGYPLGYLDVWVRHPRRDGVSASGRCRVIEDLLKIFCSILLALSCNGCNVCLYTVQH